jgi:hypothetical protein
MMDSNPQVPENALLRYASMGGHGTVSHTQECPTSLSGVHPLASAGHPLAARAWALGADELEDFLEQVAKAPASPGLELYRPDVHVMDVEPDVETVIVAFFEADVHRPLRV